jgi:hypothetical protein
MTKKVLVEGGTINRLINDSLDLCDWVAKNEPQSMEGIREVRHSATMVRVQLQFDNWKPTPENINALPDPIRLYIHDLETLSDPAGIVMDLANLKEQVQELTAALEDKLFIKAAALRRVMEQQLMELKTKAPDIQKVAENLNTTPEELESRN